MQKSVLVILFIFPALLIFGQGSVTLAGVVVDQNKKGIQGATVNLLNSNATAITNQEGKFALPIRRSGPFEIQVSAIGYATVNQKQELLSENPLEIILKNATMQLDMVTVTAQKKEELIQKSPLSISSINSNQIQQYRLWDSRDLTGIVPNLFSTNSGDDRNVTSIRGITTTSYDPAVATYVDGVNQFSLDTYIGQLTDIERVEVLRGPQGTLYGRTAMGGVINIISKQPTNKAGGFAEVNLGNYGRLRAAAGIRGALIKNKLFAGISGVFDKKDGYYINDFNNQKFDKQKLAAGNYFLKYLPGLGWSITANLKHLANRNNGAFPMVNGKDEALANPFHLSQDATAKMHDNTMNASLSVIHSGEKMNLSFQSNYQQNHRFYDDLLDADFSAGDAVSLINNYPGWNKVSVYTEEIKLSSPASFKGPLNWTTGVYFFHQDNPARQGIYYGADAGLLGAPDTDFTTVTVNYGKTTGVSVYGNVEYALKKDLKIIAGLRYDYEHKYYQVGGTYLKSPDPEVVTTADTSSTRNFNSISPKVGISYELTPTSLLYATYNRGFRPGGFTQLSSDPSQPALFSFKQEFSNGFEIASKNTFLNNRLRANAALFFTRVSDVQVPTLILPDAVTITRNAGGLESKGVEIELAAIPAKNFQAEYNFGYTDSKFTELKLSQNGNAADLDGKRQVFTPKNTSFLALQYSLPLTKSNDCKLIIRGEWLALGSQYFDLANTIQQKSYSLLNTRAGVSTRHAELMFWMKNIGDKKYIAYAYDFGAVHLGDPRTLGVTLSAKF